MTRHCFTYGSLMCEDIMRAVCGADFRHEPAELSDFSRHPVAGERYPGVRRQPGGRVAGVLYHDVTSAAIARLDAFEGDQYVRETVSVALADGSRVAADAYVFNSAWHHLLHAGEWDFEAFLRTGKREFEDRYMVLAPAPD